MGMAVTQKENSGELQGVEYPNQGIVTYIYPDMTPT